MYIYYLYCKLSMQYVYCRRISLMILSVLYIDCSRVVPMMWCGACGLLFLFY